MKDIGDELKKAVDSAMKTSPDEVFKQLTEGVNSLIGQLENAIKHPETLVPGSGPAAMVASWYGAAVATKLQALCDETKALKTHVEVEAMKIAAPFKEIPTVLGKATEGLADKLASVLAMAPELQGLKETIKGPADLAKVDVEKFKHAIDMTILNDTVKNIVGFVASVNPIIELVSSLLHKLEEFIQTMAEKLIAAFNVPEPLCFLQSCAELPALMVQMRNTVQELQKFSLKPLETVVAAVKKVMESVNWEAAVKEPMDKFGSAVKPAIENLEKAVSAAKLASGGLGGGLGR